MQASFSQSSSGPVRSAESGQRRATQPSLPQRKGNVRAIGEDDLLFDMSEITASQPSNVETKAGDNDRQDMFFEMN